MAKTYKQRKALNYIIEKLNLGCSVREYEKFVDCTVNPNKAFDYVTNFDLIKKVLNFKEYQSHGKTDKYGFNYFYSSFYFINDNGVVSEIETIQDDEEKVVEFKIPENMKENAYRIWFYFKNNNFKYRFGAYIDYLKR